jgi:hypothetical protein
MGTADSEYWNRLGVRSVLLEIPEASLNKGRQRPFAAIVQTHFDRTQSDGGATKTPDDDVTITLASHTVS